MLRSSFLSLSFAFLFLLTVLLVPPQNGLPVNAQSKAPVQIVNGYPQFQFDGQPFFAHSAAFFYNRIPRDEWAASLVKLKEMGINTVDLYVTWNWHEPEEGKLDFDGRTNSRRDLKGLMEMVAEMCFAVIVRPGPVILNEWRNGGYPDWLLARPEYKMAEAARLDGHYPPLSGVSSSNSEEASKQWLANETHMRYTRKWFADVMREVLKDRQVTNGGNVIAIQLDDDQAINRTNYNGPLFWKYMNSLAGFLREAGATVPLYINPTDMRVSAAGAPHTIGAMGQWYFNFGTDAALRWEDTATLQFYTETLKTQPHFPPMLIEYQAGWYGTGEDSYAKTADPTNTLLSSRVMIGHGLHGLNYFPVQDTLYPAGYEVPWSNHYYTWESALNLALEERPRATAVHRNGRLIAGLGPELAAAHKAADLGLVYPISSFDQASLTREDVLRISRAQLQIQQFCQLNQLSVEYLDLEFQPLGTLKRHKALLLPTFDNETIKKTGATGREEITAANEERRGDGATGRQGEKMLVPSLVLSMEAQRKLVEFVKGGGLLICTPTLPQGELLKELKSEPYTSQVIAVPDFWRAIPTEPGQAKREDVIASVQTSAVEFVSRLSRLGINRRIKARVTRGVERPAAASAGASIEPDFVATQLIADDSNRGYGFVSLANFEDKRPMRVSLNVADPAAAGSRIELPELTLRSRDALMLPLRLPLGPSGNEQIVYATAELLKHEVANGRIKLRFYAPDPADVALKLAHAPQGSVTINRVLINAAFRENTLTFKLAAPKRLPNAKDEDELAGRREHEYDVEIVYETGLPELTIKPTKLLIGETNQVAIEVANRTSAALRGKLTLTAARGFGRTQFSQELELAPRVSKTISFAVPVSSKAVADDTVILRATLDSGARPYASPSVSAEITPRFSWRVYPQVTWPLRADTKQEIEPPLFLPSDANATMAQFSVRTGNNTAAPMMLSRESLLVNALPLKLAPDEEMQSTFSFNYAPDEKSALNPFNVELSDKRLTETAKVNFLTLRKGEAVAFAYDVDRDGFDDYVMENEFLRLIISPNAGARAFALINKRTGMNVFTNVGGLRDKFVELDPADPTRNPRRKRGAYGTFNRPYTAEIVAGMGPQAMLRLAYDAPDVYPAGARIERTITLKADEEFLTVDFRVAPKANDGKQAFWSATSIAVGDPNNKARQFAASDGVFDFAAAKMRALPVASGWVAAPMDAQNTFGVFWRAAEAATAEVEMKDFSSFVNIKFKPFASPTPHTYRLAFYIGALPPERLLAERARILGEPR